MYLGDNKVCNIIYKDDVDIELSNSSAWKLKDVRHVLCLKINLISMSQLAQSGCVMTFTRNLWKVIEGALVMTCVNIEETLYLID